MTERRIARLQLTELEGQLLASHLAQGQGLQGELVHVADVLADCVWHEVTLDEEAPRVVRGIGGRELGRMKGGNEVTLTLRGWRKP